LCEKRAFRNPFRPVKALGRQIEICGCGAWPPVARLRGPGVAPSTQVDGQRRKALAKRDFNRQPKL